MKTICTILILFTTLLTLPALASEQVTVTSDGSGGIYEINGVPVYPYYVSVSNGIGNLTVMCDSYWGNGKQEPTQWQAISADLSNGDISTTRFSGNLAGYEQAGWIMKNKLKPLSGLAQIDATEAVWGAFGPNTPMTPAARAILAEAKTNATKEDLQGLEVLTPLVGLEAQELLYLEKQSQNTTAGK